MRDTPTTGRIKMLRCLQESTTPLAARVVAWLGGAERPKPRRSIYLAPESLEARYCLDGDLVVTVVVTNPVGSPPPVVSPTEVP
jgi:hypothetical protein